MCNAKFEEIQEILQIVFCFSNQKPKLQKTNYLLVATTGDEEKHGEWLFGSFGGDFPPLPFFLLHKSTNEMKVR